MTIVAFFDIAFLATLPGRSPFAHSICVQPHEGKRKPFTVGIVRVRTAAMKATLELCDRLSNPLIEVDAAVHKNTPLDCLDEGAPLPLPDYHVLWPGKPTTNTVWTAVEDYTWFEAFSEEGCATGISCTPAMQCNAMQCNAMQCNAK